MVDHHHWQLDGSAPELYQRYLVPAITTKWAEDLVDRALPRAGEAVLDIACGTGVVARLAARRMAEGLVAGLDLNRGMLAVARTLPSEGAQIDWIEGSALDLPFPEGKFDLVLCQLGLQFFPDQGVPSAKCAACYHLRVASHSASTVLLSGPQVQTLSHWRLIAFLGRMLPGLSVANIPSTLRTNFKSY